ncbi:hypothetical protein DSL72_008565 [Monilinia vaccinii-corymbosi]|uniref:Uncharacterized protein n=1 Tax=Monilinia vaccinii-corymbosi TaxID=61207 RepID=A0A8A3PPM8_9HELO|nr:hypothetical protein DSL72_008565 [Monilinia vaccinii-corymbosi]
MGNNYGAHYDKILAKATSSRYGFTDEQVDETFKQMYAEYGSGGHNFDASCRTWLVGVEVSMRLFPGEHPPESTRGPGEGPEYKTAIDRLFYENDAGSGAPGPLNGDTFCDIDSEMDAEPTLAVTDGTVVDAGSEMNAEPTLAVTDGTVVDAGSEMNAEPTLAANDNMQRKRSMPTGRGARKKPRR